MPMVVNISKQCLFTLVVSLMISLGYANMLVVVKLFNYNPPPGKTNLTFLKCWGCFLGGSFGRVWEVFVDDGWGICWDMLVRFLRGF